MNRLTKIAGLFFIATLVLLGCKSTQIVGTKTPISSEEFLKLPFGHDESIASFKSTLPKRTKIRKMVRRNSHYPSKTDTIYQFMYRHSEIFVYKTYSSKEMLMTGVIADSQIKLVNGLTTGITRDELYSIINGVKQTEADTLKLSTPDNALSFKFIFRKERLKKIQFSSYID